ncbi:hypothetical protein BDV95DRAFT_598161 [Massariosphaeria phaeospora]|uniref:Uncharacterized protein n=1 Tax=Massariosphaeria phaeospora TaxID=100035 RepID=A0A7C8MHW3_9PLEO|nr:hypothetical protein BDV95DRAFT_598161 [Massariosphaeria phaeospora]
MGQRHQAFVIAKINGRYRSLAAVHNQWYYGLTAVKGCRRILTVLEDPTNRHLLELELARASRSTPETWDAMDDWDRNIAEFPFITTCLVAAGSVDLETGHVGVFIPMPWNMSWCQGDNNDGITIFDVSDPCKIRYCFLVWEASEQTKGPYEDDLFRVPLSGEEYLNLYYDPPEHTKEMKAAVSKLEATPLIDSASLQDAWPVTTYKYTEFFPREDYDLPVTVAGPIDDCRSTSLTEIALVKSIERLLDGEDPLQEDVEELPVFLPSLRRYIYAHPDVVTTRPRGLDMLKSALYDSSELDLHYFPDLTGEQVQSVLESMADTLSFVDLSGNHNVDMHCLDRLLGLRSVGKLYLWDDRELPAKIARFPISESTEIVHPALFRAAFVEYNTTRRRDKNDDAPFPSTPRTRGVNDGVAKTLLHLSHVVWIPVDQFALDRSHDDSTNGDLFGPASKLSEYLRHKELKTHADTFSGDDMSTMHFGGAIRNLSLPLHQVPFTCPSLLTPVARFINAVSPMRDLHMREYMHAQLALLLTFSLTFRNPEARHTVHYIPPKCYGAAMETYHGMGSPGMHKSTLPISANQWTLFLVQERSKNQTIQFRLAFVTVDYDGQLQVRDLDTVMAEMASANLRETWKKLTSNILSDTGDEAHKVEIIPCNRKTIQDLVDLMAIKAELERQEEEKRCREAEQQRQEWEKRRREAEAEKLARKVQAQDTGREAKNQKASGGEEDQEEESGGEENQEEENDGEDIVGEEIDGEEIDGQERDVERSDGEEEA